MPISAQQPAKSVIPEFLEFADLPEPSHLPSNPAVNAYHRQLVDWWFSVQKSLQDAQRETAKALADISDRITALEQAP